MSHLALHNNGTTDSLIGSWVSARGGVDAYLVTLSVLGLTSLERRLAPNTTQVLLQALVPGQEYVLSVTTQAGDQATESRATARTGVHFITHFKLTMSNSCSRSRRNIVS